MNRVPTLLDTGAVILLMSIAMATYSAAGLMAMPGNAILGIGLLGTVLIVADALGHIYDLAVEIGREVRAR